MILYIIRHGQSTNNALAGETNRTCDPELTETGGRQAALLAAYLAHGALPEFEYGMAATCREAGCGITRLFVSPMRRALQTAQPVAQALGLQPEVWVELHEHGGVFLDHGPEIGVVGYPGLTRAEMEAQFPGYVLPQEVGLRGWWAGGREDRTGCDARAARVAATLRSWATRDERIALISHGDFLDALLKALLRPLAGHGCYFLHLNTAVTRAELRGDGHVEVGFLNRTDHLPPETVT
ncbi:MAG TPA: histidine phosphatase family protein [Anaerolineae bacterium]|nr:histidine phosphatase family protein [Anaerolineae bacterium]HOR00150.1 histidine phosphatase family protein [Anaerolineae bacterium]HPL28611.1 histidine phosphatase family protein [Anaerolineae bacterium]